VSSAGPYLNCGGYGISAITPCAEVYNPTTNIWSSVAPMKVAREYSDSTLLPNGKVLVCGDYNSAVPAKSCEIYDPTSNTWTTVKDMNTARYARFTVDNFLETLSNGKVIAFGQSNSINLKTQTSNELYDPIANTWTANTPDYATCITS
jgi:hypothetical protein